MAAGNLAVQILIEARDRASAIIDKIKGSWLALGGVLGGGALFGGAVKEAASFEQAMDRVGAVSGATAGEMAAMTKTARELGATTQFSAKEAAEGMSFLAMAGMDAEQVIAAMPGVLDLAAAGATDLGTASDIASNILSGFGMEAEQMGQVGDVLVGTFTKSNTTLDSLGETMKYIAPVAAATGVSLEDAAAMAGKLGDAGIQGSEAGTALRAVMLRLAAPTAEAAKTLSDLGVETTDATGNLRPVIDVLAEINDSMVDMGSADKAAAISTIAGVEATSAAMVLTAQAASGALGDLSARVSESGTAAEVAQKQSDNLIGAFKTMMSAVSEAAIAFGTPILEPMMKQVRALATQISEFSSSKAFEGIAQSAVSVFGAVTETIKDNWPLACSTPMRASRKPHLRSGWRAKKVLPKRAKPLMICSGPTSPCATGRSMT